jgi:hypothetical protein
MGVAQIDPDADLESMLDKVPEIFTRAAALAPELRAALWSRESGAHQAKGRRKRLAQHHELVAPYAAGASREEKQRLAQATLVLMSSGMMRTAQEYLDVDAAEAGRLVQWMVRRIVGAPAKKRRRTK